MARPSREIERLEGHLAGRCREAGLHLTPQRLFIYRALASAADHPSPEMLFQRVRTSLPSISLATVYKTLDTLESLGAVREVARLGESKRYEARVEPHHHLICTACRGVVDWEGPDAAALLPADSIEGFDVRAVCLQVLGVCGRCRAGEDRQPGG